MFPPYFESYANQSRDIVFSNAHATLKFGRWYSGTVTESSFKLEPPICEIHKMKRFVAQLLKTQPRLSHWKGSTYLLNLHFRVFL